MRLIGDHVLLPTLTSCDVQALFVTVTSPMLTAAHAGPGDLVGKAREGSGESGGREASPRVGVLGRASSYAPLLPAGTVSAPSDTAQGLAAHGSFPGVLGKQHGASPSPQRPWPQSGFCRVSCCPWPCPTSASTARARGSHLCLHTPLWPSLSSADRPRWAPRQLGEAHGCPRASPHGGTLRG